MRWLWLSLFLTTGCSSLEAEEASPADAPSAQRATACPAGAPAPPAPPAPRTVDDITRYALDLAEAHRLTERARAECARRLRLASRNPNK